MERKTHFKQGEIFHVFNRSIANFGIFKDFKNSWRFLQALDFYNSTTKITNLGIYLSKNPDYSPTILIPKNEGLIKFISYCIMPDHYHLLLKILKNEALSKYVNDVENSFSRFFNTQFKRKGPLWETRFKAKRIKSNELLLHVSRYIHLNPTTADLVKNPQDWFFSSFKKIITDEFLLKDVLTEISIDNQTIYKKFVDDNKDYQKKLKLIKKLILE